MLLFSPFFTVCLTCLRARLSLARNSALQWSERALVKSRQVLARKVIASMRLVLISSNQTGQGGFSSTSVAFADAMIEVARVVWLMMLHSLRMLLRWSLYIFR